MNAAQTETECVYCHDVWHTRVPCKDYSFLPTSNTWRVEVLGAQQQQRWWQAVVVAVRKARVAWTAVWHGCLISNLISSQQAALRCGRCQTRCSIVARSTPPHQHLHAEVSFRLCFCLCSKCCAASVETQQPPHSPPHHSPPPHCSCHLSVSSGRPGGPVCFFLLVKWYYNCVFQYEAQLSLTSGSYQCSCFHIYLFFPPNLFKLVVEKRHNCRFHSGPHLMIPSWCWLFAFNLLLNNIHFTNMFIQCWS